MITAKFFGAVAAAFAIGLVLGNSRPRGGPEPYQSRLMPGDTVEVHWPKEMVDAPEVATEDGSVARRPVTARANLFVYKTDSDPGRHYAPDGHTWWTVVLPGGQKVWLAEDLSKRKVD